MVGMLQTNDMIDIQDENRYHLKHDKVINEPTTKGL